jgi:dTMP kinase
VVEDAAKAQEQPNADSGVFITFEGGDGVGKSTQVDALDSWLQANGYNVVRTREPGGTVLGEQLRGLLLHGDDVDPRAEALMYAADRAHHIATVVRPALAQGAVVIQDRYIDSSVAYQGAGRVLDADEIAAISDWATEGLMPDLTVLLDLDPRLGQQRRQQAQRRDDRLEREASVFHERVREGFLLQARKHPERYLVLDATQDPTTLEQQICDEVKSLVGIE